MTKAALIIGALLMALGLIGYFGDDGGSAASGAANAAEVGDDAAKGSKRSVTALIPATVGFLIAICGFVAMNEGSRKHAMHVAALVGLLGLIAGVGRGGMTFGKMMSGAPVNTRSMIFVWLMALLCGIFVVLCIQSFRNARKLKAAGQAESN